MKKRKDLIKMITLNAMVATIYAVLTLMIQPLAYRELQLRLSEIVVLLAFYNKKLIPGPSNRMLYSKYSFTFRGY